MRKKCFLFQVVFFFSFLFSQASISDPKKDLPKNSGNNCEANFLIADNIPVSEDTYVRAGSYADDNFGSSTELFAKTSTNNEYVREILMKFDLSAYETITSAKIFIYAYAQVSMDVNAYSIDNDSWSENSATWNNAPLFNTNLGAIALPTSFAWVEFNISSAVINDFSPSDKTFSIGFKDDNTIKKTIRISSKENSSQFIPYLQIEGTLVGGGGDVAVTSVSVSPTSSTININGTQQLSATISPSNATNQEVTWSSSNPSIASVSSSGIVTGVAVGSTTVTVTTDDGSFTSNSTITVNSETEPARDVYLVIGQSNTAGRGAIEAIDMVALNGADLFNGSTWESATNTSDADGGLNRYSTIQKPDADQGLNFAYTFAKKINEDTGKQIGLVVNARGGTNINDWAKGASAGYYAAAISQINLALALPNTTIKGILWHQGESNRNDSNYLTKLSDLIADLRSDLGVSDLPFIAGQLSMERADNETFNTNLETLPGLVSNTDYAESDSLQTTDLTHFDSAAQRILGERYASKILQLVYNENPAIVCLSDISQTNDAGVDGAIVTYVTPVGTDNLPGASTVQTEGLASGVIFPIGTTTNTFVVTDTDGNTATCSFTVTVTDDEDPAIVCLADISQSADTGVNGAIVAYVTPVGTDNSTGANTLQTAGLASDSLFPVGITTNTFVVTDAAGNTATCSFNVTVTDDEDPAIECLADISQTNDAGVDGAIVTYVTPVGTDNLPGASTVQTEGLASGALFPLGTTTNTFVVTDSDGNTATCNFTVTITDDEDPAIECLADISQSADTGVNGAIVTYVTPVGTDNSTGANTVQTAGLASDSLFPVGITTNTFVVTDAAGNTATCSFTITVTDETNTCNILIDENNFNSSWGIWNDGGSDCRRSSNDASFANGGTGRPVRLRDNTSSSVMTTDDIDLSAYTEITIDFNFIADKMESGEDFWLQISTDGGSSYQTVGDWDANDEFVNGTRYYESVTIQGPFPTDTNLRFRADASANADLIYIDDVKITGCSSSSGTSRNTPLKKEVLAIVEPLDVTKKLFFTNNPVENKLIIKSDSIIGEVTIFSLTGKKLKTVKIDNVSGIIDISTFEIGLYVLVINKGGKRSSKIIIKK